MAREAATLVGKLIHNFETSLGISDDDYFDTPIYHPMAEGKYLLTLAFCQEANWVTRHWFEVRVAKSCQRLKNESLVSSASELAWGLGFSHNGLPCDEPYLITTAIVANGLGRACLAIDSDELRDVEDRALRWIASFLRNTVDQSAGKPALPTFSPTQPIRVLNSAAYAACTLAAALRRSGDSSRYGANTLETCCAILSGVAKSFVDGVGFPYAEGVDVFDLVHQCYIINSLLNEGRTENLELQALVAATNLFDGNKFLDTFSVETIETAVEMQLRARRACYFKTLHDKALVMRRKPARLWSMGEFLVTCIRLKEVSRYPAFWDLQARNAVEQLLLSHDLPGPGHIGHHRALMHVAHGLSAWLSSTGIQPKWAE